MRILFNLTYVFFISLSFASAQTNHLFNVCDFGGSNGKSVIATKSIQKAIDECAASGGGKVYFPPGEYLSGALELKSNVSLFFETGAVLFASQNRVDYEVNNKKDRYRHPVLIYADGAENISIEGKGKINGQAQREYIPLSNIDGFIREETEIARNAGVEMKYYSKLEPTKYLVFLVNCKKVSIHDVTFFESCSWTLHLQWCNNVKIHGISIFSSLTQGVNADGIDVDGCNNVTISDCFIETGDDAIVLKSTLSKGRSKVCENVVVSNCILTSTSTALKIGTETYSDFKHILFNNCVIRNSNRGLSIVVRDGADVSDVKFSNISMELNRKHFNWWGNADPIWLVVLKRNEDSKVGSIRNITFDNISGYCQGTSRIEGFFGKPLENIRISNLRLVMNPESLPDKRATHGFWAHDIIHLEMTDCELVWNDINPEPKWKSAFVFENIQDFRIDKLSGMQPRGSNAPAISFVNTQNGIVDRCRTNSATNAFIDIVGERTTNLILNNNYCVNGKDGIRIGSEVQKNQILK